MTMGSALTGNVRKGGEVGMPDRETVIAALENCEAEGKCRNCPWDDCEDMGHETVDSVPRSLLRNALELLKAQEPRVLTWDEVLKLPNGEEDEAPVVQEQKVPVGTWDNGTICQWRGARFVQEADSCYYNCSNYGKTWRCWTAWPTEEKRKAVKWYAAD